MTTTKVIQKRVFRLNEEQKEGVRVAYDYPITIFNGPAGTGKSALACHIGMKMLKERLIEKIIITRPAVATEDLGFLPGTLEEKYLVYLAPMIDFITKFSTEKEGYEKLIASGKIAYEPLAFMRGKTFDNAVVILDEAQNVVPEQMKMILTRLGQDSKILITGDTDQQDLPKYKYPVNGLEAALQLSNHVKDIKHVLLTQCERNPLIEDILRGWQKVNLRGDQDV